MLQPALISNSPYAGACTVVLFECFRNNVNGKGLVTSSLTLPENDDEDEIFDANELENGIGDEEEENEEVEGDPPSDENVNSEMKLMEVKIVFNLMRTKTPNTTISQEFLRWLHQIVTKNQQLSVQ